MQPLLTRVSLFALLLGCSGVAEPNPGAPPELSPEHDAGSVPDAGFPDPVPVSLERPPLGGGGLVALADGRIVAAHPPSGGLYVVESSLEVRALDLGLAADPGRLVADAEGRVHVVLRGAGELLTVDPDDLTVLGRRALCPMPRGLAFQAPQGRLVATCADGRLLALTPDPAGAALELASLDADLRDVVVTESRLWVAVFRAAELLELDEEGALLATHTIPDRVVAVEGEDDVRMAANSAYRIRERDGVVTMTHQVSTVSVVDVSSPRGYGSSPRGIIRPGCGAGVVAHVLTRFGVGAEPSSSGLLVDAALVVDFAFSGDDVLAVSGASRPAGRGASAVLVRGAEIDQGFPCLSNDGSPSLWSAVAAQALPDGRVAVLRADAAELAILRGNLIDELVELGAVVEHSPGYHVFHQHTSSGVACASCHPEGGDDGITWHLSEIGPRRTQSLLGGLGGTAPFHRAGDVPDMETIMSEAFVNRMGGALHGSEVFHVAQWLDLHPQPSGFADDPAAAERGRMHFESRCSSCHAGERFSDHLNHRLGHTPMQTPMLDGVRYRGPWLHDGCAETLERTLDSSCLADADHVVTDEWARRDLVAYLRGL